MIDIYGGIYAPFRNFQKKDVVALLVKDIEISRIREYEKNPRHNDKAVDAVAESIKQFGFRVPLVLTADNTIAAGHTRLKAAQLLGLNTVPCVIADDLTPEQIKAFRLADNKVAELAEWDNEKLFAELSGLTAFDMDAFGFDTLPDIMDELESPADDMQAAAGDDVDAPKTAPGDVWALGSHKLICGDCTDHATLARLTDGKQVDLLLTDPPYNVAIENSAGLTIANDDMSDAAFYDFLQAAFSAANDAMKEGAGFYVWYGESEGLNFRRACAAAGWDVKQCIVWVKNQITIGRQDYQWRHEPCLYGWKPGGKHYFIKNRKQQTVIDSDLNIDLMSAEQLRALVADLIEPSSVMREDKPQRNTEHPTMKPVRLIKKQLKNSSRRGGIVLDIFGGSGTTLLACEELARICYMCEIDPRYCDVIVKRWEAATGLQAHKITQDVSLC